MPTQLNLRTNPRQHGHWTSFALGKGFPLATWIKRVLDRESGFKSAKPKAKS